MSWHDPKSPWSRKLSRRISLLMLSCAGSLLAAVACLVVLCRIDTTIRSIGGGGSLRHILLIAVPLAILPLISVAVLARRIRVERIVLREVPKREGSLCPRCRTPLSQETPESTCPKCRRPYTRSALQSYWVDYVLEPQRAHPWGGKRSLRQTAVGVREYLLKNPWAHVSCLAAFLLVALLWMWWISGISFTGVVFRYLPMLLGCSLFGTASLCLRRYRQRTGNTQHCATCNYQRAPQPPHPDRCPECGAHWNRPGGVITGSSVRDPRHLWAACGLFGLSAVLIIAYMRAPNMAWTLRALPTAALIHDTTSSGSFTNAEWAEIQRRQLTSEQRLQLALGLLEKRLRKNYLNTTEGGWLWTQVSTGALPDDLIRRYYDEMLDLWIDAPATAKLGQRVVVTLGSTYRHSDLPVGIDEVVHFGGFLVGDHSTPLARQLHPIYAGLLDEPRWGIQTRITPAATGPLRIRAVLYCAVGPRVASWKPPVQWLDDETATVPPGAVWSHRVELEATIEIGE